MRQSALAFIELGFLFIFGVFHFALPFLLPPNTIQAQESTAFSVLHITDMVLPGAFALAILSLIFVFTKNLVAGVLLAFLYFGGIVFHCLFLLGFAPSVVVVPSPLFLAGGIVLDVLAIAAVNDVLRRKKAV